MPTPPNQQAPFRAPAVNPNPHAPRWSWTLLRAAEFWLDGGAMFGIIPRPVWLKWFPAAGPNAVDENHRIPLQTNCLLLESEGASNKQLVLIETGIGDKFPPKERALYRQEDRAVHDALHEINCNPTDINHVICTHLHFDHAGGLTRRASPTRGAGPDDAPKLVFPNAKIISQKQEWDDALANRSTMHKTYLRNHLTPEVAERMVLIEGEKEVLPGITVWPIPGHTWGQQAVRFTDTHNSTVVYVPDVMPTALHARPTTNMAYDVESYTSMQQRLALLERAAKENWTLVLDHEHAHPVFTVKHDDKGGHTLEHA
jgi:glyoxylase-like metal-dependent hydrolase (beta-lactamase superfamily II)